MNEKEQEAADHLLELIAKATDGDQALCFAKAFENLMDGLRCKGDVEARKGQPE